MKNAASVLDFRYFPNRGKGRRARGFSRFEFLASVVLIGVLATVLLEYSLRYQEMTEKAVMEATVANLRSGLRLRIAELMMQDRLSEVGNLLTENPIAWLEAPPPNYIGKIDPITQKGIAEDGWYFNPLKRELVYVPRMSRFFTSEPEGEKVVRFKVAAKPRPHAEGSHRKHEGVEIIQINQYSWF